MKRTLSIIGGLVALLAMGACSNDFTVTPLASTVTDPIVAAQIASDTNNYPIGVTVTSSLTAAANQVVTFTFTNADIDVATLADAVSIYTLKSTLTTDGTYDRTTALALGTPTTVYSGTTTTVQYSLDLSATASISSKLEVVVAADKLTASGGVKKLNLDGDATAGEADDDTYITYRNVALAGITVPLLATERDPRMVIANTADPVFTQGSTTVSVQMNTVNLSSDVLNAAVVLQKNVAGTWTAVTTTGNFSALTGIYTLTVPAIGYNEVYRLHLNNPYNLQETATTAGYRHRASYDSTVTYYDSDAFTSTPDGTYGIPGPWDDYDFTAAASFSSNYYNGVITLTFSSLGAQGLDPATVIAANFSVIKTTNYPAAPISSVTLAADKKTVYLTLDPSFKRNWDTYYVCVGLGVKSLGATTAATDDFFLGDWTNFSSYPYQTYQVSVTL
jgi:hypothetical protein